jgi:hypothetical protein
MGQYAAGRVDVRPDLVELVPAEQVHVFATLSEKKTHVPLPTGGIVPPEHHDAASHGPPQSSQDRARAEPVPAICTLASTQCTNDEHHDTLSS